MKHDAFKLSLKPIDDGSFTQLRLCGSVVTALPAREIRRLVKQLWSYTGEPVELVLPVDVGTVAWFELWTYAISEIPAHHLQVRFTLERRRQRSGGADVA